MIFRSVLVKGEVGAFYRSNGEASGANLSATTANDHLSLRYSGSTSRSDNYEAAEAFKKGGKAASDMGEANPAYDTTTWTKWTGQPQSLRSRLGTVGPRDAGQPEPNKDIP